MESSDCHNTLKLSFGLCRWTNLLLMTSLIMPTTVVLPADPSVAQAFTSSPSLNKNKQIIYVDPQAGDDQQGGKKTAPVQTITQALKIASPGSTIQLANGKYSAETGETFPLIIDKQITLQGDPQSQGYKTIIQGDGYFVSPTGAGQHVAIAAIKEAESITGITVINDHSRGHGIWVESASPQIVSNTLTRNGNTGVSLNGQSSPLIENNYFYNNLGNGLLIYGTSQPKVIKNTFKQTGFGISLVQNATAQITDNIFDSNRIGIILEGNTQGILRQNKVINSTESGLTAIAKSQVDLGTDQQPGNNIFRSNRQLDIQNATSNKIVAVGTQVQGKTEGEINFTQGTFVAQGDRHNQNLAPLPPLPDRSEVAQPVEPPTAIETAIEDEPSDLPPPPPVIASNTKDGNKELVFTSSPSETDSRDSSDSAEIIPTPSVPTISSSSGSSSAAQIKYKVLVEVLDKREAEEVRSLYPEAFETILAGQSWLQIGAFSDRDKAKQAEQNLVNLGLATYLLE